MYAPKKFVIPKENRHNSAFSFGITNFWGAYINGGFTVYEFKMNLIARNEFLAKFLHEIDRQQPISKNRNSETELIESFFICQDI